MVNLTWSIRCIDRDTREFFDRNLVFDPPQSATPTEIDSVVEILANGYPYRGIRRYRGLFREETDVDVGTSFGSFSLHGYFEDRQGNPLDTVDVIAIKSGNLDPILLSEPRSVTRLGPSEMVDSEKWTEDDSNDVAHYLQAIDVITRGEWWRKGMTLSNDYSQRVETLASPNLDCIAAAFGMVRQFLPGRDDTFSKSLATKLRLVVWGRSNRMTFSRFATRSIDGEFGHGGQAAS